MPAAAARPAGGPLHHRLALFVAAAAIPLSLQLAYVVSIPFAGRLGPGAVTSFGYAYLAATTVAGITAFSIGLVSSVPLSRIELTPVAVARHVVAATWVALVIVGATVGVLALAGADLVEAFLGAAYGDDVGDEVAGLIVVFSAWMVAAVGVNVTFPLAFVIDRLRALPWIGRCRSRGSGTRRMDRRGALRVGRPRVLPCALDAVRAHGAARTTRCSREGAPGIALAAAVVAALTAAAFVPPRLVAGGLVSSLVGLVLYAVLVAVVRPRGLRSSWSYLRALR